MGTLDGKRAIISGAASGIGRATARLFASEGAAVTLADIDEAGGQEVAREIEAAGGKAQFVACDVTRAGDCQRVVEQAVERFGGLDVLFNNAGIAVRRSVVDLDEADWDRSMNVNAKSVYLMAKYAIPHMQQAGGGSIINMSGPFSRISILQSLPARLKNLLILPDISAPV